MLKTGRILAKLPGRVVSSRRTCLVIEDDDDISGLLSFILTQEGFDVHTVGTGMAALSTAQQTRPDLITLDLGLPDMAGHDVAGRLRELTDAPVLIITAFAETGDELNAIAAGARAYLAKPFRPAELRTLIRALCPPPDDAPATEATADARATRDVPVNDLGPPVTP